MAWPASTMARAFSGVIRSSALVELNCLAALYADPDDFSEVIVFKQAQHPCDRL
jgi:hypothetical protein